MCVNRHRVLLATVSHMWSSGGGEAKRSEILFMALVYTILVLFLSLHPVGAWHAWHLHAEHKHVTCDRHDLVRRTVTILNANATYCYCYSVVSCRVWVLMYSVLP